VVEAAILAIATAALFWLSGGPSPSVPDTQRDSISFSPGHMHRARMVTLHFDNPVDAGLTDAFFFNRWNGEDWDELHELSNGSWSPKIEGGRFTTITRVTDQLLSSYSLYIPADVPPGTYLVCDFGRDCGVLEIN